MFVGCSFVCVGVVRCLFSAVCRFIFVVGCSLVVAFCLSFVVLDSRLVVRRLVFDDRSLMLVVCCRVVMFVFCCLLCVRYVYVLFRGCCLLFVVR